MGGIAKALFHIILSDNSISRCLCHDFTTIINSPDCMLSNLILVYCYYRRKAYIFTCCINALYAISVKSTYTHNEDTPVFCDLQLYNISIFLYLRLKQTWLRFRVHGDLMKTVHVQHKADRTWTIIAHFFLEDGSISCAIKTIVA